jgi:transcriptional regulator with PAS, ATPase and Fis domain
MENEFFGHRKGAFSGADSDHDGLLAQAHGGTLFLDEIGEIPLRIQVKLLRAIEGGGFLPVGDTRPQNPDFRLVAATNRDLEELVASGAMRQDFYYRINVLPVRVPPLRQRRNDIPLLFEFFLEDYPDAPLMSGHMLRRIMEYDWPGNVRELRNVLERALTMSEDGGVLDADAIFKVLPRQGSRPVATQPPRPVRPLAQTLAEAEAHAIEEALLATRGNRTRAARLLGISRSVLYEKLARLS